MCSSDLTLRFSISSITALRSSSKLSSGFGGIVAGVKPGAGAAAIDEAREPASERGTSAKGLAEVVGRAGGVIAWGGSRGVVALRRG